jgi:rhamnose transport system substrate-binding protein
MIYGSKTRRAGALAVGLAVVTLAAACSSSSKSTSSSSASAAAPATSAAAAPATSAAAAPASSAAAPASSAAAPASSAAAPASSAASSGGAAAPVSGIKKGLLVYFIPKDTQNPYEVIADKGGQTALAALGGKVVVSSGTADTAAAQIPSIQAAIQAKANAIVIAGNDPSALCPSLAQAQAAGIKVVSFDSDVTCPNHLFINQANTEQIGTSEVDLLAKEINSTGQIAILSAAATATNQNAWIGYMKQELSKYPNMKLVSTVYGNDDPATSLTVLQGLLSAYPNLAGIISPTTVGISTAAQYLDNHKSLLSKLTLTGLGLPSQMKTYVNDGTVKAFELWNPSNLGELAGYAAAQAASGVDITTAGSSFAAGPLGSYTVLAAASGTGPSVVLGPPTVYDKTNVNNFNF